MAAPERPNPPVVGKVTYHSIELYWDVDNKTSEHVGLPAIKTDQRIHYVIQEEESGKNICSYGTVYSGYASRNIFEGLESRTWYRYRLRANNDYGASPWSPAVEVCTTKQPPSGEDLQRATNRNDIEAVNNLLAVLNKELINAPDKYGLSPLMIAIQKGYLDLVEILLAHNAEVNYQSMGGKSAFMVAAYGGNVEMMDLLHKNKVDLEARDKTGSTALHWAVDGKSFEAVRWMMSKVKQLDAKDYTSGWTPLMRLAATSGDENIGRILIHHGSNVNSIDCDGKSVLMMASLNGHNGLVKMLVKKGANILKRSEHGKTALDFAKSFDHRQVTLFLEEELKTIRAKEKEKRFIDSMKEQKSAYELKGQITR